MMVSPVASDWTLEKLSLSTLQSKMKMDPEGYEMELLLIYKQFNSSLDMFKQQAALNFNSLSGIGADPSVAKDLGDRAMFLSHMRQFYPRQLLLFPDQLTEFLRSSARSLPSSVRCKVVQALILLMNRKAIDLENILSLFIELQTLGDKTLRSLARSHVVHSIRRMNQNHKNEAKNRDLQNILLRMLRGDEETIAKASLIVLCDLHRRKVWLDESTANDICNACFHPSSKIRIAALKFLLHYEKIEDDGDSDASSSEDDEATHNPQIIINKEDVYKAHHKGTTASKKKKQAKLQRVVRCMKRRQRLTSESSGPSYYLPLNDLRDAQAFAEKMFSLLRGCKERFEVKLMLIKVIARTIGLHRLCLPNFYPYLMNYVQPHQGDVASLLAAAVQACHDMVPPDVVEPLLKKVVNQFIHVGSSLEAISVGLNVVREICLRMPLLMTEALLQDLVLYKKEKERAVSSAARSLMALFRLICPSLLRKKDRGRPVDPKARPKAFGEVIVASNVPGIELLAHDDIDNDSDQSNDYEDNEEGMYSESEMEEYTANNFYGSDDEERMSSNGSQDSEGDIRKQSSSKKRKLSDFDGQLNSADRSLRVLKRLASAKMGKDQLDSEDAILSNEDFKQIRVLKAKAETEAVLTHPGLVKKGLDSKSGALKIPSADQLAMKRVDPAKLEERMHRKMTKDERMALVKAGREERGNYRARTAVKQKKKGGMSNKQKEHKKFMPVSAKRAKVEKNRQKKKKQGRSGKQFGGKKAWK